jgi:hypothetical protein
LPDPRQRGQACSQWHRVDERSAQRDALCCILQRTAELVPLTLSALNLAEFVAFPGPPGRQADGPPTGDILREGALGFVEAAAHCGRDGLRQQQPGAGPDQISGQRGKPPLNRRRFAAQTVDRVEMPLRQPRRGTRSGRIPGMFSLVAKDIALRRRSPGCGRLTHR